MGWMPSGRRLSLFLCLLFHCFGASGVTIVAVGAFFSALLAVDNERYSLGLVTTSGSLGPHLPPFLCLIWGYCSTNGSVVHFLWEFIFGWRDSSSTNDSSLSILQCMGYRSPRRGII